MSTAMHYWPKWRPNTSYCGTSINRPYTGKASEVTCKTCLKTMKARSK